MKKIILVCVILAFCAGSALAYDDGYSSDYIKKQIIELLEQMAQDKEDPPKIQCPTGIRDQSKCLSCHTTPNFKLKETSPNEGLDIPHNANILHEGGNKIGYYFLEAVQHGSTSDRIKDALNYFKRHKIKHMRLEVQSPGGSLYEAWRIVGLMQAWMNNGERIIETQCHGFAMSAGFLIFASGTKNYRLVSPTAECMWHEIMSFKMFSMDTPSSSEEESRVLRHLQDTSNSWLASVSNMTKEDLDKAVKKKELWLRGTEMVEKGFADGFVTQ